jgi:hypothetical protein
VLTTPKADELQFVFGWQSLLRFKGQIVILRRRIASWRDEEGRRERPPSLLPLRAMAVLEPIWVGW